MARSPDPDAMAGIGTHARILASLDGWPRGQVADLGAGQGVLSQALIKAGFDVYACDRDLSFCGMNGSKIIQADLNQPFPYQDAAFDLVMAVEIIEHLENPRHVLREVVRILKPGGRLVLTTPNVLNIASRISFFFWGHCIYFSQREYTSNRHITPLRFQDLENICHEVGLRITEVDFNVGKVPIPKLRHKIPLRARPFRNFWLGESLILWAIASK